MKQTVYTASSESHQIHVWHLNDEGILSLIQIVNVTGQVQPMVVSPDKRFLYVGTRPNFCIFTYHISLNDGSLTFVSEYPLSSSPTHISTDRKGNFIFSSSYSTGCVSVIRLKNGIPVETIDVVEKLEGCHSANIMKDNHTLWVLALKQNRICLFTLSDDGHLVTQNFVDITTTENIGPRHLVFHPNQKYAYIVNELNSSVGVWELKNTHNQIKCTQMLDMIPSDFSDTRRWASDIHLTPDGRYLYACDRITSLITIFNTSKDGRMLTIEGYQPTETQPRAFDIDFSGKYLIIAGQKSHHITLYKIKDAYGLLEEKGRYAVGKGPTWVVVNAY